jgi:hypothetical protein
MYEIAKILIFTVRLKNEYFKPLGIWILKGLKLLSLTPAGHMEDCTGMVLLCVAHLMLSALMCLYL